MFLFRLNLIIVTLFANHLSALENGLARTPPMGWMSWQRFRCITDCTKYPDECISENLIKRTADAMVSEGYAAAGYEYVIIDDCWLERERDRVTHKMVADTERFPSGMKALGDYIHDKGLKFGLYQDFGTQTCAGYPGIIDHMELDAKTFAEWGVDYIKLDGCNSHPDTLEQGYSEFGRLLNKTGRPMVYACSWPFYQAFTGRPSNFDAIMEHCNLWRYWIDIQDSYKSLASIIDYISRNQDRLNPHAGPGHWNDPDMLLLGNYGLSYDQSKTQMAVWAILAAPLLMSTDLSTVRPEIKEILQNRDIIAVNQDPLGIQGRRIALKNNIEVWTRPITPVKAGHHSYAVAFVSRRDDGAPCSIQFSFKELDLKNDKGYHVVDLFNNSKYVGHSTNENDIFETRVNPQGVNFYKFIAE